MRKRAVANVCNLDGRLQGDHPLLLAERSPQAGLLLDNQAAAVVLVASIASPHSPACSRVPVLRHLRLERGQQLEMPRHVRRQHKPDDDVAEHSPQILREVTDDARAVRLQHLKRDEQRLVLQDCLVVELPRHRHPGAHRKRVGEPGVLVVMHSGGKHGGKQRHGPLPSAVYQLLRNTRLLQDGAQAAGDVDRMLDAVVWIGQVPLLDPVQESVDTRLGDGECGEEPPPLHELHTHQLQAVAAGLAAEGYAFEEEGLSHLGQSALQPLRRLADDRAAREGVVVCDGDWEHCRLAAEPLPRAVAGGGRDQVLLHLRVDAVKSGRRWAQERAVLCQQLEHAVRLELDIPLAGNGLDSAEELDGLVQRHLHLCGGGDPAS
mmetsp:Transcript_33224/g.78794  ORF Transcript_33224/g.78794 Transcript_33224/m.78794 type:complete len:377 (+) Transcript_33224:770-1900(+)